MNQTAKATLLACGALGASSAHAAGFYLQEQSVRAAGRVFSGEAADQGAASIWWNPAAIGGMTGGDAAIGASAILPRGEVVDRGTLIVRPGQAPAPVGGDPRARDPIKNGVLPAGAIAYGLGRLAIGLAVTSPFSFTTDYKADSWARYTADRTTLRTIDLQPSLAVLVAPGVSIGGALNLEHVSAGLGNALPNLSPLLPDGHQELRGKGWDTGWSAGAQVHQGSLSLGLAYKSSIRHKLAGTVTITGLVAPLDTQNAAFGTTARFRTPWQAIGSARVRVGDRLTLDAQAVRLGWNKFDAIRLGAPLDAAIPELYRDTWSFAGGFDYAAGPALTLRAGVQHDQTPTRNGARDARVPDANRWIVGAGASLAVRGGVGLDAAVDYIDFKDSAIDRVTAAYAGTPAQTPILVDGALTRAHALVLALGAHASF